MLIDGCRYNDISERLRGRTLAMTAKRRSKLRVKVKGRIMTCQKKLAIMPKVKNTSDGNRAAFSVVWNVLMAWKAIKSMLSGCQFRQMRKT